MSTTPLLRTKLTQSSVANNGIPWTTKEAITELLLTSGVNGSQLPYGADEMVLTYVGATNNIHTVVYKLAGATVKTRTFTYAASGAADDDLVTGIVDA